MKRLCKSVNRHYLLVEQLRDLGYNLAKRSFGFRVIWKRISEEEFCVVHVDSELENLKIEEGESNIVRATAPVFCHFARLPPKGGVPQTKMSYYMKTDLKGNIPRKVVEARALSFFMWLLRLKAKYDRSADIDLNVRNSVIAELAAGEEVS